MTHQDVLSRIPAATKATLSAPSNLAGLRHLAGYLAALTVTSLWIALAWPLWQIMLLPQGLLLTFLFTLQHECTHKTPFAAPWLNELMGHSAGMVILQPFQWFRYFHLAHHRHTNDPEHDPELLSGAKPESWWRYIAHVSGLPTWAALITQIIRNARGRTSAAYLPQRANARIKSEARLMLLAYALLALTLIWSPLLLWLWLLPMFIGQPFLRLYLLAEHGRCAFVADMLQNTRTTYTNRLVRFLAWNMPYHIEHHSAPNVPFYQLPALHALMQDDLGVTAESYRTFTRDYARDLAG